MISSAAQDALTIIEGLDQALDQKNIRIVDLTWKVYPGKEERTMEAHHVTFPFTEKIMGEFTMNTHVSTHVESMVHMGLQAGGPDAANIPLEALVGSAVYIEIHNLEAGQMITVNDLPKEPEIRPGDIVIVGTDCHYKERPTFLPEVGQYLVDKGAKAVGLDRWLVVDTPAKTHKPGEIYCHDILLNKDNFVPILEEVDHLDQLKHKRFFFMGVPISVDGLDSAPIRAIAFEPAD